MWGDLLPIRITDLAPYHGIHPAPQQPGCVPVDWQPARPRADRVRVREHTCECRKTVYELCVSGGLVFIRRHLRERSGTLVHESAWLRTAEGERLWAQIIAGLAR